ncbi:oxidoreductase [Allomuricauda sp. d1]|uniref:oxidoreductase n=1 Tax=Allomuricauda sp. d1 TaxID=3136725 RepID=UPI0031D5D6B9
MDKKVWLITGISSGLGKALAEAVMNAGDYVIGTFRKDAQIEAFNLVNRGRGHAIFLDVTDHEKIEKVVSDIKRIDVLVNNAGIGFIGAVEETSTEETRTVFEANFFGVLKMTQAVLPKMRAQNSGHIVQISSHGGIKAFAGFGIYNASKFALEGFSEALAQEVAPLGIKVSLIEPGPFRTEFASSGLPEAKKVIYDYADTAGAFRSKLKGVHGKQEGDPKKAALAIIDLVNADNPSLRLPLGKVPLMTIQMKLDSVKADLEYNREVAENVVFKS